MMGLRMKVIHRYITDPTLTQNTVREHTLSHLHHLTVPLLLTTDWWPESDHHMVSHYTTILARVSLPPSREKNFTLIVSATNT